jgi:hypothetical protein
VTEEMLSAYVISFFVGGGLAGLATRWSFAAAVLGAAVGFASLSTAWVAYGYSVTGDVPSSVARAVAHLALYGPGLLLFGGVPSGLGFALASVSIAGARRRADERLAAASRRGPGA